MDLSSVITPRKSVLYFIGSALAVFAFAAPAAALPVTYTITGIGSGSLNNTPFTNDFVTVTIPADTSNIQSQPSLGSFIFRNPATGPATVNVAGVGTDTLRNAAAYSSQGTSFTPAQAGFSSLTGSVPPFTPSSVDPFWTTINSAFASYALATSIGPVPGAASTAFNTIPTTTSGILAPGGFQLTSMPTSSFAANVVPLPATLPLFGTGLGALGMLGWRRKRCALAVS